MLKEELTIEITETDKDIRMRCQYLTIGIFHTDYVTGKKELIKEETFWIEDANQD